MLNFYLSSLSNMSKISLNEVQFGEASIKYAKAFDSQLIFGLVKTGEKKNSCSLIYLSRK